MEMKTEKMMFHNCIRKNNDRNRQKITKNEICIFGGTNKKWP